MCIVTWNDDKSEILFWWSYQILLVWLKCIIPQSILRDISSQDTYFTKTWCGMEEIPRECEKY